MNCIRVLSGVSKMRPMTPWSKSSVRNFRPPSPCDVCLPIKQQRPCFDLSELIIERATPCHGKLIRSFLYAHHWPREPSVTGLWMRLDSPYLQILTEKYAFSGDRHLAFEKEPRTGEKRLVGVLIGNKTFPWVADELEDWAHYTYGKPERSRMYFTAHCLRSPNLFKTYNVDHIYEYEVLCTSSDVTGQGVATALLRSALEEAKRLRFPLVQIVAYSQYVAKICPRVGMTKAWEMNYDDFVDDAGKVVFFARRPHLKVSVWVKKFSAAEASALPCKPPW